MPMKKILLVEDDIAAGIILRDLLESEGYSVSCSPTCLDANKHIKFDNPDLIILDVLLPDGNGYDFAREFRKNSQVVPFIFLTSCTEIQDLKIGYELGCEDYIKKPVHTEEFLLRVRKVIGDLSTGAGYFRKIGLYRFNPVTQNLYFGDIVQFLGNLESSILGELSSMQGETIYKSDLLKKYWNGYTVYTSRNLDSVIVKLRKRFTMDRNIHIISLKKIGYRLVFS